MELYIDTFEESVRKFADTPMVISGDQSWTYAEMDLLAHRIAQRLIAAGVKPGSHVGIYSPNHVYGFACQWGLLRAGCVWAPLNYRMGGPVMRASVESLDIDWLFFHSSLEADLDGVPDRLIGTVCFDRPAAGAPALLEWLPAAADPDFTYPVRTADDAAELLQTSGTTGQPKGILQANRAFIAMQEAIDATMPIPAPPVHLIVAPISHAAGQYAASLNPHGATHILLNATSAADILEAIERHRATTILLPPTLVYALLADPAVKEHDYSSMTHLIYGTAPMSPHKAKEAWDVFGPVLIQGYGQSEALQPISALSALQHAEALTDPRLARRLESVGRPSPNVQAAIMADSGELLPHGQTGEIVLRGDLVMKEYYKNPEATAESRTYGWHHTGDVGFLDEDGFLYLVDRKKEMIISGGFNVFPSEVERAVLSLDGIRDCAVVGIPDDKWGEAVLACVELRDATTTLTEAEIIAHCRPLLGGVKTPKHVVFTPSLPRNANGKVLRREVRAPYWKDKQRAI